MTQPPEPPPYGTVPAAPGAARANRTADVVLSWVLYAVQVLASLAVGFISLFAIFLTGSCGSTSDDAAVCDGGYLASVIFSYWIALVALVIGVPIALAVAGARKRPSWPWAVGGFGLLVLSTILFFALVAR